MDLIFKTKKEKKSIKVLKLILAHSFIFIYI